MWWIVSVASAGTVCPTNGALCDFASLAAALDSNDPLIELLPGQHLANVEVTRQVDITAQPGATVRVTGDPAGLTVRPGGTGSTFTGLVLDPDSVSTMLLVNDASVTVTDAVVSDVASDGPAPAFQVVNGGTLTLERPTVTDAINVGDGMIRVVDATLVIRNGLFRATAASRGGAIWSDGGALEIIDTTFEDTRAYDIGNALWMQGGSLSLTDSTIDAQNWGIQLELQDVGLVTFTRGAFVGGGEGGTALHAEGLQTLVASGTTFSDWQEGAISAGSVGSIVLRDAVFARNRTSGSGGALGFAGVGALVVDGSWFCDNESDNYGGALNLGICTGGCAVTQSVFQENQADSGGGAISAYSALAIDHSTFRGNEGSPGGAVYSFPGPVDMERSLVFGTRGQAAALTWLESAPFDTNGLGDNELVDASFPIGPSNRVGFVPVLVEGPGLCGGSVVLAEVAANAWALDNEVGVRPEDPNPDPDLDGDGFPASLDCDDLRNDVSPGAAETPADGTDQDCDGTELCPLDADGDGFAGEALTSSADFACPSIVGDCDDYASDVFPGATDTWYDGVDSDCAGDDDQDRDGDGTPLEADCDDIDPTIGDCGVSIGGGCSTGSGPQGSGPQGVGLLSLILAAGLATGRRRR